MRINRDDTLILAIDYQQKLVPVMTDSDKLIDNTVKLIKGAKVLGIPIMFTQQYTKGLGMTLKQIQDECCGSDNEFEYYDKLKYSCYADDTIKSSIDSYNKKNIVICGIEAHICVLQTAMDLIDAGYDVMIVADCVSSRKTIDLEMGLRRAESECIRLTTYEALLFEATGGADMEGFKEISKIIK